MATQATLVAAGTLKLEQAATFPRMRALAWNGETLYAARGYSLYSARMMAAKIEWRLVASYRPQWWRQLSSGQRLSSRLVRDGFHALAITPAGNMVAAVPGAIVTLRSGETEFHISHRVLRGTRPLHIARTPDGGLFWGEYFDNSRRDDVHICSSRDGGESWDIAFTFGKRSIRHVHNITYDKWADCLLIFTGDDGGECRILRASTDFTQVQDVVAGGQQARAVAAVIEGDGLYFASDTPFEQNFIYHLDRRGRISRLAEIPGSSIHGCRNRDGIFFSTMAEPSQINTSAAVNLFGSADGGDWRQFMQWRKDLWPMKLFQYGNAQLPDGENATGLLAVSTVAVAGADLQTSIWRTSVE